MINIKEKQVKDRIVSDMMQLLSHSESEGIRWCSTKTDLMEMTHYLYCADIMKDEMGLPVTFLELVRRVCRIVHVTAPTNPNHLVSRAMMRKGRKMLPLMQRYNGLEIVFNA